MRSGLGEFTKKAQEFSRNPLGIIALFIVLVYGIAGLVLSISGANLQAHERLPLIWFLVIFPIIVLAVFYRLVTHHHVKLYAPQDFPDKEGFFRALSPNEQKQKLDEEVQDVESELGNEGSDKTLATQKQKSLTRTNIVLAEDLALREIENEFGGQVYRQVTIAQQFPVDGVFNYKGKRFIVEVKYVRRSLMPLRRTLSKMGERFRAMLHSIIFPPSSFILAVVAEDLLEESRLSETQQMGKLLGSLDLPIQLRIYDFNALKQKYGINQEDSTSGD